MTRNILVCGGAGYIGSHMVRLLRDHGHQVVVFDNLSQGHAAAIPGVELVQGDLLNPADLADLFARHPVDAVIHFAALTAVGESVAAPDRYYRNNVCGTLNLLDAMRRAGVDRLVFSSTAAVFGSPLTELIDETHPLAPINPYGWSKRMTEQMLADMATAHGLRSVSLRYFNAAGAHPSGQIGEAHQPETHLVPLVLLAALGKREGLAIFGSDYPTRDGTCIRDYVHVSDLASAHLKALDFMNHETGAHVFNLGNGNGFTTLEVIEAARRVTGREIPFAMTGRRPGDAGILVADSRRAREVLGWQPQYGELETIIDSAWRWHQAPAYGPFASL
ncbi:UDP-glucose 4-epimerase GalE [Paracoccus zhejiangensis]|uniref:UDP-glucose 4-epimerase n=1 Tax=Paracoccus zhejiangensis TaxID=1077935 RepID=A0A2H5F4M9_9RHOB|nr:UDP-glucose 4-epimerase GalE [Paracoccus zhejiangensis]AUH66501.1 UDP-glucose 4-epimerase GalE [Paracoccus zhejiangensis]